MSDTMTVAETCAYLRMSKGTLARMRHLREGPAFLALTPKLIRYRKLDVDAWLMASRRLTCPH